ncbi:peptidase M23 [Bacteroidia bacterium]|nr:peptidase M23 [Bacteroidia bacterium]
MTKKLINILILLFFLGSTAGAQTKAIDKLKVEQKKTMERLAETSRMLEQNAKSTKSSLARLTMLTRQIADRQLLISQINEEIVLTDKEITRLNKEIGEKNAELEKVKQEYAELIYHTYLKRNSHDKLMFVLSAKTFSQSYRRLRYLQEFSDYRKTQAQQIEALTIELGNKLVQLDHSKKEKERALRKREQESKQLEAEKQNQQTVIEELKKDESDLRAKLREQQRQMDNLNNKIAKLIADEERKAREKAAREKAKSAAAKGKAGSQVSGEYTMTKEEKLIAGNFEKNKGRLLWPVEKGMMSGKFGTQPHPVLQYVTVNNKGIYIDTERNADARAVFEGVVTQRFTVPGNNNAVIVKHGNYRTVYSNLTEIYVNEGDKVTAKQKIGKIYTDTEAGNKTTLYFMVWKDTNLQNPELFLAK